MHNEIDIFLCTKTTNRCIEDLTLAVGKYEKNKDSRFRNVREI